MNLFVQNICQHHMSCWRYDELIHYLCWMYENVLRQSVYTLSESKQYINMHCNIKTMF